VQRYNKPVIYQPGFGNRIEITYRIAVGPEVYLQGRQDFTGFEGTKMDRSRQRQ
jgi:hypothetical protein